MMICHFSYMVNHQSTNCNVHYIPHTLMGTHTDGHMLQYTLKNVLPMNILSVGINLRKTPHQVLYIYIYYNNTNTLQVICSLQIYDKNNTRPLSMLRCGDALLPLEWS